MSSFLWRNNIEALQVDVVFPLWGLAVIAADQSYLKKPTPLRVEKLDKLVTEPEIVALHFQAYCRFLESVPPAALA